MMKVAREYPLSHVRCERIRAGDPVLHFAAKRGEFCQPAHGLAISAEPCQFVTHMPRAIDTICFGDCDSGAHERVQQGKLIADCCESMKLNKCQCSCSRQVRPVHVKHTLPGYEYTVKDRQDFYHLVIL